MTFHCLILMLRTVDYGALLKARTDAVAAAAALAKSPIDLTGPSTSFTGMGQKLGGTPTTKKAVAPTQKIPEKKRMWEKTDWNKVGGTPSGSGSGSGSGGGNAEASGSGLKPREKRALELKEQNEKRQKFLDDFEAQGIPMPNKKRRTFPPSLRSFRVLIASCAQEWKL